MKLVLHRNFDVLMAKIRAGEPLDDIAQRVHFRAQAAKAVDRCAKHAYALFSACGGRGIFTDFPLHRYLFDIYAARGVDIEQRSEEHTSELQSLMRISYAVFCLKKKNKVSKKKIQTHIIYSAKTSTP